MTSVPLQCECGSVRGMARNLSFENTNRITCYCKDCQAFPEYLGKADTVLDAWGGTDICQMPQAWLDITHGEYQLRCLRLSRRGAYRWYAGCCNTPIGNTMGPGWPFIGVIHSFMHHEHPRDEDLGPSRGNVWVEFAREGAPDSIRQSASAFWLLLRTVKLILVWKVRGLHQPSAFFSLSGRPAAESETLSR